MWVGNSQGMPVTKVVSGSILLRPVRKDSKKNYESAEDEYQREQDRCVLPLNECMPVISLDSLFVFHSFGTCTLTNVNNSYRDD